MELHRYMDSRISHENFCLIMSKASNVLAKEFKLYAAQMSFGSAGVSRMEGELCVGQEKNILNLAI